MTKKIVRYENEDGQTMSVFAVEVPRDDVVWTEVDGQAFGELGWWLVGCVVLDGQKIGPFRAKVGSLLDEDSETDWLEFAKHVVYSRLVVIASVSRVDELGIPTSQDLDTFDLLPTFDRYESVAWDPVLLLSQIEAENAKRPPDVYTESSQGQGIELKLNGDILKDASVLESDEPRVTTTTGEIQGTVETMDGLPAEGEKIGDALPAPLGAVDLPEDPDLQKDFGKVELGLPATVDDLGTPATFDEPGLPEPETK